MTGLLKWTVWQNSKYL